MPPTSDVAWRRKAVRLTLAGVHLDHRAVEQACAVASDALGAAYRLTTPLGCASGIP